MNTLQTTGNESAGELSNELVALGPWFHNIHLPDGTQTAPDHPLGDFPAFKWRQLAPILPEDLTGWRALDIGCNAGFYTFELARRGATVLGIDADDHYLRQAEWVKERFGYEDEQVTFRQMQVYELLRIGQTFDLVMFMGVFYHLRYPLLALDIVSRVVEDTLVFQSLSMPGDEVADDGEDISLRERARLLHPGWPKMAFVQESFEGDPTNWWIPNHACITAMLHNCGFEVVARPGHEIYLCEHSQERERAGGRNNAELDSICGRRWI